MHGDAWGPSKLALHVLAYIVADLQNIHRIPDDTVKAKCLELWKGSWDKPGPKREWSYNRRFSDQTGERLHASAPPPPHPRDPPVHLYQPGEKELLEQLNALHIWPSENDT